jgi:hypothetical protein
MVCNPIFRNQKPGNLIIEKINASRNEKKSCVAGRSTYGRSTYGRSTYGRYTYAPVKMEQTKCSETLAYKIQTPGNYPEESIQHSEHGESLK